MIRFVAKEIVLFSKENISYLEIACDCNEIERYVCFVGTALCATVLFSDPHYILCVFYTVVGLFVLYFS